MNYTFLPVQQSHFTDSAFMALSIRFENDSIINAEKYITSSGMDSLTLASDSALNIKEIKGFIYYLGQDNEKGILVDKISLMRYHHDLTDSTSVQ